ncbi:MAG: sulfotransferase [Gammaproteobacteria bacterium]|nr:sulfotransferase [Gammaproteobacteria bacterium]
MAKPNFFIVGAPKCGTTAMNDYLKQHPEIFIPNVKELHYFGSDLNINSSSLIDKLSKEEYLNYFSFAGPKRHVGESSVLYLSSKLAAEEIYNFNSNAKIIIMLREPFDMMCSLHSQLLSTCKEDIEDFGHALDAESDRFKGGRIPANVDVIDDALFYKSVASYYEQVKRYIDRFGKNNVHVILFDDFKFDALNVYKSVLEFLGIKDVEFEPNIKIINSNKILINRKIYNLANRPPIFIKLLVKLALPGFARRMLVKSINNMNIKYVKRKEPDQVIASAIRKEFFHEITKLENLIDKDLSTWKVEGDL